MRIRPSQETATGREAKSARFETSTPSLDLARISLRVTSGKSWACRFRKRSRARPAGAHDSVDHRKSHAREEIEHNRRKQALIAGMKLRNQRRESRMTGSRGLAEACANRGIAAAQQLPGGETSGDRRRDRE